MSLHEPGPTPYALRLQITCWYGRQSNALDWSVTTTTTVAATTTTTTTTTITTTTAASAAAATAATTAAAVPLPTALFSRSGSSRLPEH